jgi:signal peptidase I
MTDRRPVDDRLPDDGNLGSGEGDIGMGADGVGNDDAEPSDRVGPGGRSRRSLDHPAVRGVRELAVVIVVALVATALLRAFVLQAFFVPSGSMIPTIHINDRIVVSRISHLARGEVVVFQDPGGWLSLDEQPKKPGPVRRLFEWVGVLPNSGHGYLVKRVVGLPGDHVVCCARSGDLLINGKQVDESYIESSQHTSDSPFDVVVPAHRIFVLGDNRFVSGDSSRHLDRTHPNAAFVPESLVTGRAVAIIWPWKDRRVLGIPKSFAAIPSGRTPPARAVVSAAGLGR